MIFNHIQGLSYEEKPNYEYIKKLLHNLVLGSFIGSSNIKTS